MMYSSWEINSFNMQQMSLSGSHLFQEYEVCEVLGQGTFGTVLKCANSQGSYAIKVIIVDSLDPSDCMREIEILKKVSQHKNLVQYITSWEDNFSQSELDNLKSIPGYSNVNKLSLPFRRSSLNVICIQMELCGKNLRSWLKTQTIVNEQNVIQIFIQLVGGLEYIHNCNFIHRDLKPENIFMGMSDPLMVKIGDLGSGIGHKSTSSEKHTTVVGTKIYWAPEQRTGDYGKEVDKYALGIILFELFNPSIQANEIEWESAITDLKWHRTLGPTCVQNEWPLISQLILKMTSASPTDRPSFSEMIESVLASAQPSLPQQHPYVSSSLQTTPLYPQQHDYYRYQSYPQ